MEVGLSEVRVFLNISHERNSVRYIRLRLSPLNTNFLRLFTTREAITWRADPSRWRKEIERGKIKFTVTKYLYRLYEGHTLITPLVRGPVNLVRSSPQPRRSAPPPSWGREGLTPPSGSECTRCSSIDT